MIISCPECRGRFRIDPSALGAGGRTVRCSKCAHTWLQVPPDPEAGTVREETTDPVPAADAAALADADDAADGDIDSDETDKAIDWDAPAARDDEGVPDTRQIGNQVFRDTVTEIALIGVARQVVKRQDRD